MPEFRLTAEERARHAALSPVQADWLDFVAARPEALERSAFADLDAAVELEPEKVQPWPLFADPRGVAAIDQAGREAFRLIKTVPERIFGSDPERMAEFYGIDEPVVRNAAALLADPACLAHLIGRGDFILGPHGFACCEFNVAGNLGGWQVGPWKELFRSQRLVAEFLAAQGLNVLPLNPLDALLEHAIEVGRARGLAAEGELNLALLTQDPASPALLEMVQQRYVGILARRSAGLAGSVIICREPQMTWEGGRARYNGTPVHLFVDQMMEVLDGPVFRAQAAGRGFAFNGLVSPILTDKRNLALLSEQADDGDLYDAEERAAIDRFIPWTRVLAESFTEHAGERIYLPDFVLAERERLLIKPAEGFGGRDVLAGAALAPAEWEARVDAGLADGRWIVQEFVPSETFLFQAREGGAVPHEIVWGAFVFGGRFGSCLLRGAPAGAGVINVGRGARRIVLLEVEDGAA
ncbi:MAG TPA: hypothetical protein VKK31_04155 [Thermoanaerobaculia bacterium]|nr:hypothetical protein [Thermoanaerobaculia bacterium]